MSLLPERPCGLPPHSNPSTTAILLEDRHPASVRKVLKLDSNPLLKTQAECSGCPAGHPPSGLPCYATGIAPNPKVLLRPELVTGWIGVPPPASSRASRMH